MVATGFFGHCCCVWCHHSYCGLCLGLCLLVYVYAIYKLCIINIISSKSKTKLKNLEQLSPIGMLALISTFIIILWLCLLTRHHFRIKRGTPNTRSISRTITTDVR